MNRTRIAAGCVASLLTLALVGCQQPDMSEMMQMPDRPAELDQLAMFAGTWEDTAEMKMGGSDKLMKTTGVTKAGWEADKWLLLSHFEGEMEGEPEDKYRYLEIWTWDAKAKKYRFYGFGNWGGIFTGTATYDEPSKTWRLKGKSRCNITGDKTVSKGQMTFVDDDTMQWDFTEWSAFPRFKIMEMKGTSHRK